MAHLCVAAMIALLTSAPLRTITYSIAVRGVPAARLPAFAAAIARIYADPRGWSGHGLVHWKQVSADGDLTVWLASPDKMPSFNDDCSPKLDCRVGPDVIINAARWDKGSRSWPGNLAGYRTMIVNHETGHYFGLDHVPCPKAGAPAPIMMQQSKSPKPCLPNPWPLASELRAAGIAPR